MPCSYLSRALSKSLLSVPSLGKKGEWTYNESEHSFSTALHTEESDSRYEAKRIGGFARIHHCLLASKKRGQTANRREGGMLYCTAHVFTNQGKQQTAGGEASYTAQHMYSQIRADSKPQGGGGHARLHSTCFHNLGQTTVYTKSTGTPYIQ